MKKYSIKDKLFSHAFSSCDWERPTYFEWSFNDIVTDFIFLTDYDLLNVDLYGDIKKYAWLVESPEITPMSYKFVFDNHNKFDKIFTFDKSILDTTNNSHITPYGGCWIKPIDRGTHFDKKCKMVSMVSSGKMMTTGHRLRKDVIDKFGNNIDLYGRAYKYIDNKIESLLDYKFQIVIENTKRDYYFTEKLIDCLQTGVIPIYWGCPSIGNFFDINGVLTFETESELSNILNSLSDNLYLDKVESIKNNFELSKNYLIAEDYIYLNYNNII